MARMARAEVFAPDEVAVVHVMNRVFRRCYLPGDDPVSGKNYEKIKGVRTHKRASRPFLTLAESSCIAIQRMPNKAFNTDGEYAAG